MEIKRTEAVGKYTFCVCLVLYKECENGIYTAYALYVYKKERIDL